MALKRVSLSKAERETAIGTELLQLCQTITEDGTISREEITELVKWLKQHQDSNLPSVAFLVSTVKKIIADGKVTKQERMELHKALERVLPPDLRREAQTARQYVAAEERAAAREKREELRIQEREEHESLRRQEREERQRHQPIEIADFMVTGVRFEGRDRVVRAHIRDGNQVFLVRDKQNRHSRNAIEVRLFNGLQIGFMPEDDAVTIAPLLDQGARHFAQVKKIWTGGQVPIPVVVAKIYRPALKNIS